MASTSIYLNFPGTAERALRFHAEVFGTSVAEPLNRWGDVPASPEMPPLPEEHAQAVMHGAVPILGGHVLMASDALEGFGPPVQYGTHVSVSLHTDSRDQADALYASLAEGGQATFPLQDAFWGGYFGQVTDQFGVQWMLHYDGKGA